MNDLTAVIQLCREAGGTCDRPEHVFPTARGAFLRSLLTADEFLSCLRWFNALLPADQWRYLRDFT